MNPGIPSAGTLPARMPHYRDNVWRKLCRGLLRLSGWRLEGALPDCARLVLIGAPHSSWWDGIWGLLMKVGIGAEVHFMIKDELFRGPMGALLRTLGGIAINRRAARGVVEQMTDRFDAGSSLWLAITPEGTRKPVARWKSGFWHIARQAGVPIFPVAFHYPDKLIVLGPLFETTDDMQADIARLRAFYAPYQGKHHGV
ncbi:MAG TPA: lysophospholipid acyltransferase family protein [Rhodanobacteraceae bacterium]|nr:lysophospholipid acyltransferase family protein [Rhodanobacteraceae bacterium]